MDRKELYLRAETYLAQMKKWRRELHQIPEEAFREIETTQYLCRLMEQMDVPYRRLDPTGLVAEISGAEPGPCIALRADIDALRVTEDTGLPFASTTPGMMHACGHDVHMAIALGALSLLKEMGEPRRGSIRVIFQPGEELGEGAERILPQGVLDGVDAIFGLHIFTGIRAGAMNIVSGPRMAGSANFTIRLKGKSGHGSSPYQGIDVIPAAASLIMNLQTIPSREVDSRKACVVSIGTIHSGTRSNVIAGEAEMTGTCRSYDLTLREDFPDMIERILNGTCAAYRVQGELEYFQRCPVVINDPELTAFARQKAQDLGIDLVEAEPLMLSEDFACYGQIVPSVFAFLGGGAGEPNHNPRFMIDESSMVQGAAWLAACALYTR